MEAAPEPPLWDAKLVAGSGVIHRLPGIGYFSSEELFFVAEPISASLLAATCALGMVKGLSGKAATAAASRALEALRASRTPDGEDVLKSTHVAVIRSIQLMAEACSITGGEAPDRFSADALSRLATDADFTDFRATRGALSKAQLGRSVKAIFNGGNPAIGIAELVIASIEEQMGRPLTEVHRKLFRHGSDKHRSWPEAFTLFFAEQVRTKERVFRSLAFDRLNELLAFAEAHGSDIAALHQRLSAFASEIHSRLDQTDRDNRETRETLARMEAMLAAQTGVPLPTLREIAREFGELQPGADTASIEGYLREKAVEYHQYRERSESLEVRDNHGRALLAGALEAIDAGHFEEADGLISEAEDYDEEISRELRLSADQRDIARSTKRSLRGDAARMKGDFPAALGHYDAAAAMLPPRAREEWWSYRASAADVLVEWGNRFGDSHLLPEAIARRREILASIDKIEKPIQWGEAQNELGVALARLAEKSGAIDALTQAAAAFRKALTAFAADETVKAAIAQNNLGNVLAELAERTGQDQPLEEALKAYESAIEAYRRLRLTAALAQVLSNFATLLGEHGVRKNDLGLLERAIEAFRLSLSMRPREDVPNEWAITQANLSNALAQMGQRESNPQKLEESIQLQKEVLEVQTRDRMPMQWAMGQSNLGNTLLLLSRQRSGTAELRQAAEAYELALEERTADKTPLARATTNLSRILALGLLSAREGRTDCADLLEEALRERRLLADAGHVRWTRWGDHVVSQLTQVLESSSKNQ